jgi:hypothetical protein
MNTPIDTWNYFIAGYAVILCTLAGYMLSLALRWKKLKNEENRLKRADQTAHTENDSSGS